MVAEAIERFNDYMDTARKGTDIDVSRLDGTRAADDSYVPMKSSQRRLYVPPDAQAAQTGAATGGPGRSGTERELSGRGRGPSGPGARRGPRGGGPGFRGRGGPAPRYRQMDTNGQRLAFDPAQNRRAGARFPGPSRPQPKDWDSGYGEGYDAYEGYGNGYEQQEGEELHHEEAAGDGYYEEAEAEAEDWA
jgi:hypothetical protein